MKRIFTYCSLIIWTLALIASCGRPRLVTHGFVDVPQDSILFDLKDYVLPASEVNLWNVVKCGGYFYFTFHEQMRGKWGSSHSFLMGTSEDKLKPKYIPLPDGVDDFSFSSVKNDTLVIGIREGNMFYGFNPKEWEWTSYTSFKEHENNLYEDYDWMVKHVDGGEFGEVTWFIDKHTEDEFAFVGLNGSIRRIDSTLYVVNQTRVYRLNDPTIGFHCDSTTRYENAKDVHLIAVHFHRAGYSVLKHNFLLVVHFDNEPAAIEEHTFGDMTIYDGGFYVSEYAKADTSIIGSFVASDTLFLALNTPSGLELAKLNEGGLITIHSFNKDVGEYSRFRFFYEYPSVASASKYRDESDLAEEKLLILLNDEAGASELFDIARDGNALLKLCYDAGGLEPVEQDGFSELLSFYLNNWDLLTLEKAIQEEKSRGGAISYLGLEANRNSFPPQEIFSEDEKYHIDMVTKQIGDSYEVESSYWVQESNNSIPAVYMNWSRLRYNSGFDPKIKYEELAGIITDSIGPGILYPATNGKMKYTEWHSGQRVIKLYGNSYDVRFIMY